MTAQALIRLEEVSKTHHLAGVEVRALLPLSLEIGRGEFVAIRGPSGSGKSTLLHILGLLDRPSQGVYRLGGTDTAGMSDDELSALRNRRIGFVFQSFYLIPYISALNNVLMPGLYGPESQTRLRARAEELMDMVGLSDRTRFKPSQLSGGQQQRVALARALLNDPELVLADEPTGQLDTGTSKEIMRLLGQVRDRGKTVIVVTHDPETAAYSEREIIVRDGQIVSE